MRNPRVSAVLIVKNERENLAGLLPVLCPIVDEVVVVDDASDDGTRDVARAFGCRVLHRRFDTFSRQRNYALARASHDWILSIDADERPSDGFGEELRRRIVDERFAAYRVRIRSSIFGREFRFTGTQDDVPIRLFRRDEAAWIGDVHEVLRISGRTGRMRKGFSHRTHASLHVYLSKLNRYAALEARTRVDSGVGPRGRDLWLAPPREVFRRLVWKGGFLDGPEAWAFSALSGLCEWTIAMRHRAEWGRWKGEAMP